MISTNTGIFKWIFDLFKIKGESAPVFVEDFIQPVVNVDPNDTHVYSNSAINATETTILTLPTDKDFYLTGAAISIIKDATATSTYSRISVISNGVTHYLCHTPHLSATSILGNITQTMNINRLKLDRGTSIKILNQTNVANISSMGSVWGFYVE